MVATESHGVLSRHFVAHFVSVWEAQHVLSCLVFSMPIPLPTVDGDGLGGDVVGLDEESDRSCHILRGSPPTEQRLGRGAFVLLVVIVMGT